MIGDYFIEQTLIAGCSLDPNKNNEFKEILRNILNILEIYTKINENELKKPEPINSEKLELINLLNFIITYRLEKNKNFNFDSMIEGLKGGVFDHLIPFIESKKVYLEQDEIKKIKELVYEKKKLFDFFKEKENLQQLISKFESGDYVNEDEIISLWETSIKTINNSLVTINSQKSLDEGSELNLFNDDFDSAIESLKKSLNSKRTFKSGFDCIDDKLPSGGFEENRLYLIGGTSGVGKSIFLINLIRNGVNNNIKSNGTISSDYPIIYITAENLIYESLLRLYCCFTGESVYSIMNRITYGDLKSEDIKRYFLGKQIESNTKIIFKYVKPLYTKVSSIEAYLKTEYEKYGGLRCVLIDYLDLIKSDIKDDIRIEQGYVSQEFKNMAVAFRTPIITATQLNRSGYNADSAPSLIQMGESMLKTNNADFILFLQNDTELTKTFGDRVYRKIRSTILKNRNGPINDTIHIYSLQTEGEINKFNYRFDNERTAEEYARIGEMTEEFSNIF